MKLEWKKFNINGNIIEANVSTLSGISDRWKIKRLYHQWKKLNDDLKKISTRGINLPETISENAFCLFFPNCVRIVKLKNILPEIKNLIDKKIINEKDFEYEKYFGPEIIP